ncbi:MAG: prolipoprotein diacylglyceryl transferase [Rhodospirillaceae bacterium]|jgi:phosphatidylglycerol:prolipoprotein diacylglycerol transferase|nr:prolipoprotein diacylglyceryl transferase [Rhodospirillaceae bacterium]
MAISFPAIDPEIVRIGPIAIRWYAIAYIVGLIGGWKYMRWLVSKPPFAMTTVHVDDFLMWVTCGVILGGRLGYVLFYNPLYYFNDPLEMLIVWKGGMSFHGGVIGVIIATMLFCWRNKLSILMVSDIIVTVVPIGLFFGRIANFVNGELFGRITSSEVPWAMIFPNGGPFLRHPSQLYEAGLEGLFLLIVMYFLWCKSSMRLQSGFLSGCFLLGYGLVRIISEFFRQPDVHLGFLCFGTTMGQLLSLPMLLLGIILIVLSKQKTA